MVYGPAPIHHIGSTSEDVPSGHSQSFMESTALGTTLGGSALMAVLVSGKKHGVLNKISSGHVMYFVNSSPY